MPRELSLFMEDNFLGLSLHGLFTSRSGVSGDPLSTPLKHQQSEHLD